MPPVIGYIYRLSYQKGFLRTGVSGHAKKDSATILLTDRLNFSLFEHLKKAL